TAEGGEPDRWKLPQADLAEGLQITTNPNCLFWRAVDGAKSFDFGTQDWYTRAHRACEKCLILLGFCDRRGNPSLSASAFIFEINLKVVPRNTRTATRGQ